MTGGEISSGLLMCRFGARGLQVFLVHPGGPFWTRKEKGAWSIPKGEVQTGDDLAGTAFFDLDAAAKKINPGQMELLERPRVLLSSR